MCGDISKQALFIHCHKHFNIRDNLRHLLLIPPAENRIPPAGTKGDSAKGHEVSLWRGARVASQMDNRFEKGNAGP